MTKRRILLFAFMALMTQIPVFAQSWSVGSALIYGDDIGQAGVHFRGYYNLEREIICFGPEFSHFFRSTSSHNGEHGTLQLDEVNFNIHYIFEITHKWAIYPVTGLNVSREKEEIRTSIEKEEVTVTEYGIVLGFGIHRPVNNWVIFGEFDHLFSDLGQNSLVIGTFYTFGKKSEEHHKRQ